MLLKKGKQGVDNMSIDNNVVTQVVLPDRLHDRAELIYKKLGQSKDEFYRDAIMAYCNYFAQHSPTMETGMTEYWERKSKRRNHRRS